MFLIIDTEQNGKTVHPLMQYVRVCGSKDYYGQLFSADQPFVGELPEAEAQALGATLRYFTATPDRCYLLVWEGYGGIERMYPPSLMVELHDRTYLAYQGSIDEVLALCIDGNAVDGPNLWWTEDRAWIVSTEIDLMETYIGGSADCIAHLLSDPLLEAFPASIYARVDFLADTIN